MRPLVLALACALSLSASAAAAPQETEADPLAPALAAYRKGDFAAAAELAGKVPADHPRYLKARYLLGECALARRDGKGAEEAFRAVLEKKPDAVPALVGVGRALLAQGRKDEALKESRRAVEADGKDAAARRTLGEALAANGKLDEALPELKTAWKADRKDPLTVRALVEVLVRLEKLKEAGAYADGLVKDAPKDPVGPFLKALVLDREGEVEKAIAAYEKAIALDPAFLDAHKNLAILCTTKNPLYSDRERTEKAFKHYAKYFELGGEDEELKRIYETIRAVLEKNGGR